MIWRPNLENEAGEPCAGSDVNPFRPRFRLDEKEDAQACRHVLAQDIDHILPREKCVTSVPGIEFGSISLQSFFYCGGHLKPKWNEAPRQILDLGRELRGTLSFPRPAGTPSAQRLFPFFSGLLSGTADPMGTSAGVPPRFIQIC